MHEFPHVPFLFHLFHFLIFLLAVFVIFRIMRIRRFGCGCHCGCFDSRLDAEEILKRRYINHEISEDEYLKMKEVLRK